MGAKILINIDNTPAKKAKKNPSCAPHEIIIEGNKKTCLFFLFLGSLVGIFLTPFTGGGAY